MLGIMGIFAATVGLSTNTEEGTSESRDGKGAALNCSDFRAPEATKRVKPKLRSPAQFAGKSGEAVVAGIVTKEGQFINPRLKRADHESFAQPSIEAAAKWRFKPATCAGKPVTAYYDITFRFKP